MLKRNQAGLKINQFHIQGAIKTKISSDGGQSMTQPVRVGVSGTLIIQVPTAGIINGFIVHHDSTVRVLPGSVGGQDGVAGFYHHSRPLMSWVDGDLQLLP